jgi:hypothetical protein
MTVRRESDALVVIGWREWVGLPDLGLGLATLKAKVDTGARTSALHAHDIEHIGDHRVRFAICPHQRDATSITVEADLIDERHVRSSSGETELRLVVRTAIVLGAHRFDAQFTLTDRALLGFRVLLGREALRSRFVVDPGTSYRLGGRRTRFVPRRPPA